MCFFKISFFSWRNHNLTKNEKNRKSSNLCTFQISAKSDHIWMSYSSFNFSAKISKNCFSLIKAKILNIWDNIENIICSRDYPASFWWKLAMSENKWMSLLKPKKVPNCQKVFKFWICSKWLVFAMIWLKLSDNILNSKFHIL